MLSIKQKPGKKNRKLQPNNFDLYLGNSRVTGKQVSRQQVLHTLQVLRKKSSDQMAQAEAKMNKAKSDTSSEEHCNIVRFPDSTIIDTFKWDEKAKARFVIDEDSFMIRNEYLPSDDDAPRRICDIAKDICEMFNQYYDIKSQVVDHAVENCSSMPELSYNLVEAEDGDIQLTQFAKGGELVHVTGNCSTEAMIVTLFWLQFKEQIELGKAARADIVVPATGQLPELTFKVTNDGGISTDLNKLSGETKGVFQELMPRLSPTG